MKITDIKTFIMQGGNRNWVFCKVETDEGVHGWGEGTLELHEQAVESGIKTLATRLVGRDPTEIEKNWQERSYLYGTPEDVVKTLSLSLIHI